MSQRSFDLALISTFAAFTAVCSLLAVTVGVVPVPITLQTFAVLLAGLALGPRRGALAVLLYVLVGLAGLPVFAGGQGGLGALASPSAGYLVSFPLAAAVAGSVGQLGVRRATRLPFLVLGGVAGALATYVVGVPVMAHRAGMSLTEAIWFNNAFLPFDSAKVVLAAITAAAIARAFPALVRFRSPAKDAASASAA